MVEYAALGNLRQFLQERRPGLEYHDDVDAQSPKQLTVQDLLSFCYQVAKGMEFLSSRKVNYSLIQHCVNPFNAFASCRVSYLCFPPHTREQGEDLRQTFVEALVNFRVFIAQSNSSKNTQQYSETFHVCERRCISGYKRQPKIRLRQLEIRAVQ